MPDIEMNYTVLVKPDGEKFIFIYRDEDRAELLRVLGRFASNPDLNFNWYDCAVLSNKICWC